MCGAVHCSDIGLVGIHRKPPMIDHKWADQLCEIPLAVAACPMAAVRPTKVDFEGKKVNSVAIKVDRCMYCGNCYTMCPALPIADHAGDGIAIMVGGKVSNRMTMPKFSKVCVAYIENEPPRWPTLAKTVRKIVVDHFLQSFADTMVIGDAEKIDYYRAHPEMFLRGKTSISGAILFFRDWQSGDQYYRGHKNIKFDSLPGQHYLLKKMEPFEMVTESPDTCFVQNVNDVEVGVLSKMKYCGGALKMLVVTLKQDSADVLPYEEVAEDVAMQAWLEHRTSVMERLKKEWKMERPIFSKTDIFSEKDK
jgi:ferredoxin